MNKPRTIKNRTRRQTPTPMLRFTPTAWAKLLFLRDYGDTEVGGFGICPNEPLMLENIQLVKQTCSIASVIFADDSVADFFDEQVDRQLRPEQFGRVWIHTHPGDCPQPSGTDEETFARVFGQADWAVMFILARHGETYARLRFNVGPGAEVLLPMQIDYRQQFAGSNWPEWKQEYLQNVHEEDPFSRLRMPAHEDERWEFWPRRLAGEDSYEGAYLEMLEVEQERERQLDALELEQQEEQLSHGHH